MSLSTAAAPNIYSPGCQTGDFAQPHICGAGGTFTASGHCYLCNTPWTGSHICLKGFDLNTRPSPTATILTTPEPVKAGCDHCWCLKQKAGWHDVPNPTPDWPGRTITRYLKRHQVCCNCGNRRLRA